jgi:cysteinyl-tRNA synthetase
LAPDAAALERFIAVMDDDFNTPGAVSLLFDLVRDGNRILDESDDVSGIAGVVEVIVEVLGFDDATEPFTPESVLSDDDIARLVGEREKARTEKRFADADAIRDTLDESGVVLEDGPDGTRWLRK